MPGLSSRFPIGDTSPLAKFVIGLNGLIEEYRDGVKASELTDDEEELEDDPWTTDLFFRQRPLRKSEPDSEDDATGEPESTQDAVESKASSDSAPSISDGAAGQAALDDFWEQQRLVDPVQLDVQQPSANRFAIASVCAFFAGVYRVPRLWRQRTGNGLSHDSGC